MDLGIAGMSAVVTGASRGIGLACALALAREGARIAVAARGREQLDRALEQLKPLAPDVLAMPCDMTDIDDIDSFFSMVADTWDGVDILVNNVGGGGRATFKETDDSEFARALELNLFAAIRATRHVLPHMELSGFGRIITISSIWGREAGGRMGYNIAKAAQISWSKALAREVAPHGITSNCLAPGSILFPGGSWERRQTQNPEEIARFIETDLPRGSFGSPEEVGSVVAFLASTQAGLINGACIPVDGAQGHSNI